MIKADRKKLLAETEPNDDSEEDANISKLSEDSGSDHSSEFKSERTDDRDGRASKVRKPAALGTAKGSKPSNLMTGRDQASKKPGQAKDTTTIVRNTQTVNKYIQASLSRKVENLVEVFNKEFTITRPYCNRVTVKVPKTELL